MSWRDNLETASFRGVEFGVKSSSVSGGRRSVLHEFPMRAKPYTQDLGLKAKEFSISAFVVGSSYLGKRDKLINALDKKGTGTLIHPYYGSIDVQVKDYSISESYDMGGMAEFSISFFQSDKIRFTNIELPNGIAYGESFISDLFDFSLDSWIPQFDFSGVSYVLDSVVGGARAINALGKKILSPIASIASVADDCASAFNSVAVEARSLATQPIKLFNAFQTPFKKIIGGLGQLDRIGSSYSRLKTGVKSIDNSRLLAIKYGLKLFRQSSSVRPSIAGTSETYARIEKNNKLIVSAYRLGAVCLMSDSILSAPYDTLEDSKSDKLSVMDSIDELCEEITFIEDHETVYNLLKDLKINLNNFVPADGSNLKDIKSIDFNSSVNSLAATYQVFGNLENEESIILRNSIRNPAIVDGISGVKYLA